MKKSSAIKYQGVRAELEEAIRTGEFAIGQQLPSEHSLANRFGVSYLTARRAVSELVEADLLERRACKGTYVRSHEAQPQQTTTLSLITSSYDHSLIREFISMGSQIAEEQQWKVNVIRLSAGQQDAAVRAIRNGDLALAMLDEVAPDSALAHAMRAAKGRAICIASAVVDLGVTCIINPEDEMFQAPVDYLVAAGHSDILLVFQSSHQAGPGYSLAWRRATSALYLPEEADARSIPLMTTRYKRPTLDAYTGLRDYLRKIDRLPTAIVSFGEEITQGVLAAIRDHGCKVPDDISVLNIMDTPSMCFAHPPVTSVDIDLEGHFRIALEHLKAAQQGKPASPQNIEVKPLLIERSSIRSLLSTSAAVP